MQRITKHTIFLIILLLMACTNNFGQGLIDNVSETKHHRIGGFIGYNHYPGGAFNNYRSFFIASIGIEYDYKFSHNWGFGLKFDLVYPNYSIPNGLGLPDITIKYPSAMIKYYFSQYLNALLGGGVEMIEDSSYSTIKVGAEYKFILANGWDFKPVFSYSIVNGFEDTYELIFSIGKSF